MLPGRYGDAYRGGGARRTGGPPVCRCASSASRAARIGDAAVRTSVVAAAIARFFASCASSSARSGVGAFETVTGAAAGVGTGSSVSHTSRSSRVIGGTFALSARSIGNLFVVEIFTTMVSFDPPKLNPLTAISRYLLPIKSVAFLEIIPLPKRLIVGEMNGS